MEALKTAVIGSRSFGDYELLRQTLDRFLISELISGGARGADKMAEHYADMMGLPKRVFLPDYQTYGGKKAPLIRNGQIVAEAQQVIAFWDGKSTGTMHAVNQAKKLGKIVHLIRF
jgi:hypothetical protein